MARNSVSNFVRRREIRYAAHAHDLCMLSLLRPHQARAHRSSFIHNSFEQKFKKKKKKMFYSRSLLARKAPLGQIWMAATTHGKINRKKLNKLNIIKICEEILNPSVPMALRLSGILMGGVVIVYERKVKLLYNDVNRLLVEINQAWKVKSVLDPTLLPKAKSQAKYEAITLPAIREEDMEEMETLQHSDANTGMGFTQTAYFAMRLDNMDDSYINPNPTEDLPQDYHQANADDITMLESYDPSLADTSMHNRFDRFDIEGAEETQVNFTVPEHTTIPSTLVPSPPPKCNPQADEILEQHPEGQVQQAANGNEVLPDQRRQGPTWRRARRPPAFAMDNDQTIIPGHIFQSWLQDTSDIASRRRNKKHSDATLKRKIANLMDLPPTVLFDGLFTYGNREVHFPASLLEIWRKSSQPLHGSPSVRTSTCQPPEPSRTSPPEGIQDQYPLEYPFEDFHSGVGSQTVGGSIEMLRTNQNNSNIESEIKRVELAANTRKAEVPLSEANGVNFRKTDLMATPANSSDEVRSIPSSGSGHSFPLHNSEINSARSNKKRTFSSSSLEPVSEENSRQHDFKLARLSENELMVETGLTQTQKHELTHQPTDHITHSIKMQLKAHFEKPGSPEVESLNQLARGMDRRKAAILFYQTCVLATKDSIKVHQKEPYGDILISTGPNM